MKNTYNKIKLSVLFLIISVCKVFATDSQNNLCKTKDYNMTIFIHGTILPASSTRFKGHHQYQPINSLGLIKIDDIEKENEKEPIYLKTTKKIINNYNLIKKDIEKNIEQDKKDNSEQAFYTFGWDGNLSKKSRLNWSKKLYEQIVDEIEKIKKDFSDKEKEIDIKTNITIIAHSHGGNVALNLALAEKEFCKNIQIKKLILLGTPVQSETRNFINSDIFVKIYNIYSSADLMQVIDMVSTKDSISHRKFKIDSKNNFTIPDKLKQIEVMIDNKKPSHGELWLLGENKLNKLIKNFVYRESLSIYPFPVVVFVPKIIDSIEKDLVTKNLQNNYIVKLDKTYLDPIKI
ncbi:hypothetical protein K9L05_01420 [Candidatus Babeliales bacterium]|nr:hypothetical protein [Candidatus Babeliales bacterium]MCF7899291.1 hypothetical protein [Candidatus Babeliales bacterium]